MVQSLVVDSGLDRWFRLAVVDGGSDRRFRMVMVDGGSNVGHTCLGKSSREYEDNIVFLRK